jgi:signal transduction histidine kinase
MLTESGYERSQITWGFGYQEESYSDEKWYFSLDEGLDDEGQIALAKWIVEKRNTWSYKVYTEDVNGAGDGSYAVVTGIERSGNEIAVQKIEIVHPDGLVETMVETSVSGESQSWRFAHLEISSVLLPSWSSDGHDGPVNMERRLASFREAHAALDRELEEQKTRPILYGGGFILSSTSVKNGIYHISVDCNFLAAAINQNTGLYISTAILILAVLVILAWMLSRTVTGPTEALCREVAQGQCHTDGPVKELNTLAVAFNAAQEQLEGQLERERTFTRSAAHELKTPLSILRAHAEYAKEDLAPARRNAYLDVVLDESDRMADLVNELLELARLESDTVHSLESVELTAIVKRVWDSMALSLEQKQIALVMDLDEIALVGDKGSLERIVTNLASNALRHTPQGGTVRVSLHEDHGQVFFTVENDGNPIPEADLPRIWEPFYRVDQSRNRSDGGTGLGLTVVRAATLAHGGTYSVQNTASGVRFEISIPQSANK